MPKLTDETLMLYADGLLASPDREHVERQLTDDNKLRSRLQVFQLTGPDLATLMEDHVKAPVPDRLMNCLLDHSPKRFSSPSIMGVLNQFLVSVMKKLNSAESWTLQPVLAAMLMAMVGGIGLGWLVRGDSPSNVASLGQLIQLEQNRLVAQGDLQETLEHAASGTNSTVALSDSRQIAIGTRMTFRDEAGHYCREYEITSPSTEYYDGVACRTDGKWVVRIQSMTAPFASRSDQIVPAGGGRVAMDAAVGALVLGAPLSREEEAALINNRWN